VEIVNTTIIHFYILNPSHLLMITFKVNFYQWNYMYINIRIYIYIYIYIWFPIKDYLRVPIWHFLDETPRRSSSTSNWGIRP
ncbi:MAG: hypothetical protein N7Q72_02185, partial [Spiroplasma sp. Tabriz.8]|nr:hypothetical protein [Spiroplasma sp. Tabriz.8]